MHALRTANFAHIADYNELIGRSKSVWAWPAGYLSGALELLRITPDYLEVSASYEILQDNETVGFCSLINGPPIPVLDHLWIEPGQFGKGAGRFAVESLCSLQRSLGAVAIDVWPDPPAEGFYVRLGFQETREITTSRVECGPVFRRFRYDLEATPDRRNHDQATPC